MDIRDWPVVFGKVSTPFLYTDETFALNQSLIDLWNIWVIDGANSSDIHSGYDLGCHLGHTLLILDIYE